MYAELTILVIWTEIYLIFHCTYGMLLVVFDWYAACLIYTKHVILIIWTDVNSSFHCTYGYTSSRFWLKIYMKWPRLYFSNLEIYVCYNWWWVMTPDLCIQNTPFWLFERRLILHYAYRYTSSRFWLKRICMKCSKIYFFNSENICALCTDGATVALTVP